MEAHIVEDRLTSMRHNLGNEQKEGKNPLQRTQRGIKYPLQRTHQRHKVPADLQRTPPRCPLVGSSRDAAAAEQGSDAALATDGSSSTLCYCVCEPREEEVTLTRELL